VLTNIPVPDGCAKNKLKIVQASCNLHQPAFVVAKNDFMKKYIIAALIILSACNKDAGVDSIPVKAGGEVLFISRRISNSADWQLFLMNADGSNQRRVSDNIVSCSPPVRSNNGQKILFTSYDNNINNLYVIDIDGQNKKLLSQGRQFCGSASWSPDDSSIVFIKNNNSVGGNYDIYSIKADGSSEVKLTSGTDHMEPQYSPANDFIIFSSSNNNHTGIYKMNIDGSNKRLLTPAGKSFSGTKISPDGSMMAVVSNDWNGSQIFTMHSDGSKLKQITFTVSSKYFDTGFPRDANGSPVWSPDSKQLAYVSYENGSPDIYVINGNGTGNKQLTNTPLRDEHPVWTRDGNYIVFSSNRQPNVASQIYIMQPHGQSQKPLTDYPGDNIYPSLIYK